MTITEGQIIAFLESLPPDETINTSCSTTSVIARLAISMGYKHAMTGYYKVIVWDKEDNESVLCIARSYSRWNVKNKGTFTVQEILDSYSDWLDQEK